MSSVTNALIDEEGRRGGAPGTTALIARSRGSSGPKQNIRCYACGKTGHISRDCRTKWNDSADTANIVQSDDEEMEYAF
ncbi:uncharacterized protein BT62DRAFT_930403 [Guyanagaster necrorhizus]|uniref:CCHC-type domain-containing protein n=1 Tax=Guyanagaster necrorhizus TaxID=856835 RepID=A0A9P7VYT7_9AGAR|nr:uncharacterized protein BT62DRAFT_930403 [Guyanagaster necrorhizus MCA 3950]KAG7448316.1 hypothetical protein BT62DRAFT_930403 [Guyanagaster necrorhizus MCA 3950]